MDGERTCKISTRIRVYRRDTPPVEENSRKSHDFARPIDVTVYELQIFRTGLSSPQPHICV